MVTCPDPFKRIQNRLEEENKLLNASNSDYANENEELKKVMQGLSIKLEKAKFEMTEAFLEIKSWKDSKQCYCSKVCERP